MKNMIQKILKSDCFFVNCLRILWRFIINFKNPLTLFKLRLFWLKYIKHVIFRSDVNFRKNIKSNIRIDVVIPTIEKDFDVVTYVVDSIRKYVKHPLGDIIIISPPSEKVIALCKSKGCRFIDENKVLPLTIKDIDYRPKGVNRSGWVFQQLLKWGADKFCSNEYFLITESDTVFIRPRIFEFKGKVILPCSTDACHLPYFRSYEKLTEEHVKPLVNFTSHHSLFQKTHLTELKSLIEKKCQTSWYQAILNNLDNNETSCVSDYETYGQFIYSHYPGQIMLEHWFNLSLKKQNIKKLKVLTKKCQNSYKAISFHDYNK